jgi:CheY-like chemotaxis protein
MDEEQGLKRRVLAVDDNAANLLALEAVLGRKYTVIAAKSGPEAIGILEDDDAIDVILMDIQMPEMDGFEAASRIKKIPHCADIPLIFITAIFNEDPHIKRGYELGAVDYFTKPFDPDILRLKVDVYSTFRHRATILKIRERQLRESEDVLRAGRKLATVLEGLPVGVIIADVQGRICQANEEILRILKSAHAIETGAYGEVLTWWERNDSALKDGRAPLARVLATGDSSQNEIVAIQCLDGTTKNLLQSTSPLRGLDGSVVGAVVVLQDITEHQKFEADFEARITRLVSLGVELEQGSSRARDPS